MTALAKKAQQRLHLLVKRGEGALNNQVKRRRSACTVAQRQAFQDALIQLGLDAFLRQPAIADLREDGLNGGIDGGEGP